jgi:ATP-dependent RNA helicase RhlE
LSFCDVEEKPYLRDIQKLINGRIPVIEKHPFLPEKGVAMQANQAGKSVSPKGQFQHKRQDNRRNSNFRRK